MAIDKRHDDPGGRRAGQFEKQPHDRGREERGVTGGHKRPAGRRLTADGLPQAVAEPGERSTGETRIPHDLDFGQQPGQRLPSGRHHEHPRHDRSDCAADPLQTRRAADHEPRLTGGSKIQLC